MKKMLSKSINGKLIRSFLFVGLVPMLIVGIFQYIYSMNLLIEQEKQAIQQSTAGLADSMDEWLQGKYEEVKLGALTDEVVNLNQAEQLAYAKKLKSLDEAYEAVFFMDTEGIVRAHTTEKQIDNQSLWEREYFQDGLKGQDTITNVLVSNVSGNRMIAISTPVYNAESQIVGVFAATVNFDRLANKYLINDKDQDSSVVLVDSSGVIQAHPNEELINVPLAESGLSADWIDFLGKDVENEEVSTVDDAGEELIIANSNLTVPSYKLYTVVAEDTVVSVVKPLQLAGVIAVIITSIAVVTLAIIRARGISRPIVEVTDQVESIAHGDLTVPTLKIRTNDEVGRLEQHVNTMHEQLTSLIAQIQTNAVNVASSATELEMSTDQSNGATSQIARTVENFGQGAEKQMHHVERTVQATNELSTKVNHITDQAEVTSLLSQEALVKAGDGNDKVQLTVKQMESIFETMKVLAKSMNEMETRSNEIDKIVDVISSIADQTNLLSLNASIEAARAGEHGKGFAVVANEVRSLAEQSSNSAHQINQLIANIQSATNEAVRMMDKGQKEVEIGVHMAYDAGKLFEEIRAELQEVTNKTVEVSQFANDMESSTQAVSVSMQDILEISTDTLQGTQEVIAQIEEQMASIEEITSSTHSLSDMADELSSMASQFKINK